MPLQNVIRSEICEFTVLYIIKHNTNYQILTRNGQEILMLKETACIRKPRPPTSAAGMTEKREDRFE